MKLRLKKKSQPKLGLKLKLDDDRNKIPLKQFIAENDKIWKLLESARKAFEELIEDSRFRASMGVWVRKVKDSNVRKVSYAAAPLVMQIKKAGRVEDGVSGLNALFAACLNNRRLADMIQCLECFRVHNMTYALRWFYGHKYEKTPKKFGKLVLEWAKQIEKRLANFERADYHTDADAFFEMMDDYQRVFKKLDL